MAVKTISRNGKRVPAESKGKGQKKPRTPKAAATGGKKGAGRKSDAATVMPRPKAAPEAPGKPAPIWDNLKKPWSLTTCHRIIAIAVEHNNALSSRSRLKEQMKYVKDQLDEDELSDSDEKKYTQKLYHLTKDIEQTKLKERAAVCDMVRLSIESVGGTVFEQAQDQPAAEDEDGDEKLFPKGSEHLDKHDGTTEPMKSRPVIGRQYFISDKANALIWAVVRVDGPEKKGRFCVTIVKHSAKWDRDPVIDFEDYESREDSTDYSESQDHEPADYRDLPVDHLQTIEAHGAPLVSDAAIACLKRAEIETIRQISKIDGIYGLSDEDKKAIGTALERLEKQAEPVGAAA